MRVSKSIDNWFQITRILNGIQRGFSCPFVDIQKLGYLSRYVGWKRSIWGRERKSLKNSRLGD